MTEQARRRRPHPAAASRRATTGLATALTFGLVAVMSWPSLAATEELDQTTWSLTPASTQAAEAGAVAPRRVQIVVRRHHAGATEQVVRYVQAAPATTRAAASAPRPAPKPRTRSGGS